MRDNRLLPDPPSALPGRVENSKFVFQHDVITVFQKRRKERKKDKKTGLKSAVFCLLAQQCKQEDRGSRPHVCTSDFRQLAFTPYADDLTDLDGRLCSHAITLSIRLIIAATAGTACTAPGVTLEAFAERGPSLPLPAAAA